MTPMVEKGTSVNTVSKLSSKSPSNTVSKSPTTTVFESSTVLADPTEKALHRAEDRFEDMAASRYEGERLMTEDWWAAFGVEEKNATIIRLLEPLLKNYVDLVPSVSACTGALLGCQI